MSDSIHFLITRDMCLLQEFCFCIRLDSSVVSLEKCQFGCVLRVVAIFQALSPLGCWCSLMSLSCEYCYFLFTRLMFPLALTAQYFGMSNSRMSLNVLARSFPWIGIYVDVLRTGGRRMWPLFRSHMLFLLIQSFVPGRIQSWSCRFQVLNSALCQLLCFLAGNTPARSRST